MSCDAAYRRQKVTDAAGNITEYDYDSNNNRTDVWDAQHTRTGGANSNHFAYDALGRQISVTDPLGNVTTQEYNAAGDLVSRIEPRQINGGTPVSLAVYGYDLGSGCRVITSPVASMTWWTRWT